MPYAPKAHKPRHATAKRQYAKRSKEHQRAYGHRWSNGTRERYLAEHPLCEDCEALGVIVRESYYVEVDHIIPIDESKPDQDPLLHDLDNLRTRCRSHHALKTSRYDKEISAHYKQHGKDKTLAAYRQIMTGLKAV